jgi:bifunctional NMN adenylyltransferase/nudix hydrolase
MTKKFGLVAFICRAEPLHNAHVKTILNALELSEHVVIVLGSANQPRTIKNPFTVSERTTMIETSLPLNLLQRISIVSVEDNMYNDTLWAASIHEEVTKVNKFHEGNIGIIGHVKDESSFYLKMFPQWEFINQPLIEPLNSTNIREMYFSRSVNFNYFTGVLPCGTVSFLKSFQYDPAYQVLLEEKEFVDAYKKQYEMFPYPPIFVTTDAVVIQSGHVLMIKRRSAPGKGLWALPGGFVNAMSDKSILDAMIRELYEETNIKVPEKVIRGSIIANRVFDAVGRSLRGRTVTHAFAIVFGDGEWKLPKIQAADDAVEAKWIPISELDRSVIFEDHKSIIEWAIASIK